MCNIQPEFDLYIRPCAFGLKTYDELAICKSPGISRGYKSQKLAGRMLIPNIMTPNKLDNTTYIHFIVFMENGHGRIYTSDDYLRGGNNPLDIELLSPGFNYSYECEQWWNTQHKVKTRNPHRTQIWHNHIVLMIRMIKLRFKSK